MPKSSNSAVYKAGYSITYTQDKNTKKWSHDSGNLWSSSNSTTQFAKEAHLKVGNRAKNHAEIPNPFKTNSFADFLNKHLKGSLDFKAMAEKIATHAGLQLSKSRSYDRLMLTFLNYKCDQYDKSTGSFSATERLLIILLKDKTVLRIQQNKPSSVEIIDFDDILHAAMIDVNDFKLSLSANSNFDVSFINGSSKYFIDFLDAEGLIQNTESVNELFSGLDDFLQTHKIKPSEKNKVKSDLSDLLEKHDKEGIATTVEDVSHRVYNSMSPKTAKNFTRSSFEDHIVHGNYKVNETFFGTKSFRDKLDFVPVSSPVGELKIRPSFFAKKSAGKIDSATFDKQSNNLTIKTQITDSNTIASILKAIE